MAVRVASSRPRLSMRSPRRVRRSKPSPRGLAKADVARPNTTISDSIASVIGRALKRFISLLLSDGGENVLHSFRPPTERFGLLPPMKTPTAIRQYTIRSLTAQVQAAIKGPHRLAPSPSSMRPGGSHMQCPHCQSENRAGRRFCAECGTPLALPCAACGFVNEPGEKFCGGCGTSLTEQPTAPRQSAPAPTPQAPLSYTPRYLAEKILQSQAALEGERKQVTVLFADIKGSTELIEGLDPEAAQQLLDPALHHMIDAVHRYEGTVNQVLGDGIMALFGAPIAHEDHALRACYAALAMQAVMQAYADDVRRAHGLALRIRVGLNSGEVVVRAIGNDLHMDYSAVGQTTHLAARMEQLAAPGSIILAAPTLRRVEGFVRVKALGPIPVKGLTEPVEVCELLGA